MFCQLTCTGYVGILAHSSQSSLRLKHCDAFFRKALTGCSIIKVSVLILCAKQCVPLYTNTFTYLKVVSGFYVKPEMVKSPFSPKTPTKQSKNFENFLFSAHIEQKKCESSNLLNKTDFILPVPAKHLVLSGSSC